MLSLIDSRTSVGWVRNTVAGCTGAAAVLPVVVTLGLLAYAPLGAAAPLVALSAVFFTAGVGGGAGGVGQDHRRPREGLVFGKFLERNPRQCKTTRFQVRGWWVLFP